MKSFREFREERLVTDEPVEELDEATMSRAVSILGAAVIASSYKKVKQEKNIGKKIDRLADLILTASAQNYHLLKQVRKDG